MDGLETHQNIFAGVCNKRLKSVTRAADLHRAYALYAATVTAS